MDSVAPRAGVTSHGSPAKSFVIQVLCEMFSFTSEKHHSSVRGQWVGPQFGGVVLGTGSWPEDMLRGALQRSHLAFLCFPSPLCPQTQPISLCGEEKQR